MDIISYKNVECITRTNTHREGVPTTCGAHPNELPSDCARPRMSAAIKEPLARNCRLALINTDLAHLVSNLVISFELFTNGRQHVPLHLPQLKSPAARRSFHSAPFPRQPAEASQEKENEADAACDEADVHARVGRGWR